MNMISKKPLLIFIAFVALLAVSTPQPVFAELATSTPPVIERVCLEVPLPNLPGLPADPCSSPAAYIQYWFYFALYLAGIAALIMLVAGGVMYMISATVPGAGKGTKYIINAVLGLILLFGSYLLLRTLGGEQYITLKNPKLPQLPSCFIDFDPSPAREGEKIKVSWQIKTKGAFDANAVCRSAHWTANMDNPVLLRDARMIEVKEAGEITCSFDVRNADTPQKIIEKCSASVKTNQFFCALAHKEEGFLGDTRDDDEISWNVHPKTTEARLNCPNTLIQCPGHTGPAPGSPPVGDVNDCKVITYIWNGEETVPPSKGGPATGKVDIKDRVSDTCTMNVKFEKNGAVENGSCSVNIKKSQEIIKSNACEIQREGAYIKLVKIDLMATKATLSCSTKITCPNVIQIGDLENDNPCVFNPKKAREEEKLDSIPVEKGGGGNCALRLDEGASGFCNASW